MEEKTGKCSYCGKARPLSELHQGEIIFIGWGGKVEKKRQLYCKDSNCYGSDQMAHEG